MATAATPAGTTHNTSEPLVDAISPNQLGPNEAIPTSGGKAADQAAGGTHRVSKPLKDQISAGQRRPDQSPHA